MSVWRRVEDADALDAALLRVERVLAPELVYGPDDLCYGYEPLPAATFLAGLAALGAPEERIFLDVGCGIGTKLALAHAAGWKTLSGFDQNQRYIDVAAQVCPDAGLERCDLSAFPAIAYYSCDVVYMFRPYRGDVDQAIAEHHVVTQMRPGALAFFPHAISDMPGVQIAEHVWRLPT